MVSPVGIIRNPGMTVDRMVEVQPAGQTMVAGLKQFGQELNVQGEGIFMRQRENTYMTAQATLSRETARIERDNLGDPLGMEKGLNNFRKSFLGQFRDPEIKSKLDYQFEAQVTSAMNRSHARMKDNIDQEARFSTTMAMDEIQTRMDDAAKGVMSGDPGISQSSMVELQNLMDRATSLAGQKTSDGSFLFAPEQVANMTIAARDKTHSALVRNWFTKQPNSLQAAEQWLNGGVEYDLPNGPEGIGGFNSIDTNIIFNKGLIGQESGGNQFDANGAPLQSPVGATGIAQVMPATGPEAAKLAGVAWDENKFKNDADYNKRLGRAYFDAQIEKYGDKTLALMAYNAGPGAVDDFMMGTNKTGKNPNGITLGDPRQGETTVSAFVNEFPFKETRDYVNGVKSKTGFTPVNIRESMPSSTRQKIDNEIMGMLQDKIAIENHQIALQQRADQNMARQTMIGWVQELSAGPREKTINDVVGQAIFGKDSFETDAAGFAERRAEQINRLDAQKQIFVSGGMADEYTALRKSLVAGNPLAEDGSTIVQMKNMMARGQDVSEIALSALNGGRIGPDTYDQIVTRQETLRGPAGDPSQFLLRQIQSSIAGLTPTEDPNSAVLVYNAQTSFLDAVDQWKSDPTNKGRTPTIKDLKPLADQSIQFYNPNDASVVPSLNAPSYIPPALYSNRSAENVEKMKQKMKDYYSEKYAGDAKKIKEDPVFKRDFMWLKTIEQSILPSSSSVGE